MPTDGASNRPIEIAYCSFARKYMDVRVAHPIAALRACGARVGHFHDSVTVMRDTDPDPEVPKVIITQRMLPDESWLPTVRVAIERDWLLVAEWDDYPIMPIKKNQELWEESMKWRTFETYHGIQTSTPSLQKLFLEHNPNVSLFQNQLHKTPAYVKRTDKKQRLFFGALNRKKAWQPLVGAINDLIKRYPNIQPVVVYDKELSEALEGPNVQFFSSLSYEDYMKCLASCDIALLPLHEDQFTRHKSDIKFVEASAGKTAVVASPTVYADTVRHGETGLIANTVAEWQAHLEKLITDPAFRDHLARNAYSYVLQHRLLRDHIGDRIAWYYSLWEQRAELNARLLERFPA